MDHLSPRTRARAWVLSATVLLAAGASFASEGADGAKGNDWDQWRGPTRDGIIPHLDLGDTEWPAELERAWSVATGGGHSSPIVAGGAVFVHSRGGDDEIVSAFGLTDGRELWSDRYPSAFATNSYAGGHGKGPFATPLVHDGTLYTLGVSAILSAYEAESGRLQWRKKLVEAVDSSKLFCGTAASPLRIEDTLVVYVGDDRGGRLIALETGSGDIRWEWQGDGPGYASPVLAHLEGVAQVITLSDSAAVSVAAESGELLWRLPFPDEWNENVVTPLVDGERVILAGVRRGSFAVAPRRTEAGWRVETAWDRPDHSLYLSSPVLSGGTVYGMSNKQKGRLIALDAETGSDRWSGDGRLGESAALLVAGKRLLALTTDGVLLVFTIGDEAPMPIARYELSDAATWAHPAVAHGLLLVRDAGRLTAWRLPSAAASD